MQIQSSQAETNVSVLCIGLNTFVSNLITDYETKITALQKQIRVCEEGKTQEKLIGVPE